MGMGRQATQLDSAELWRLSEGELIDAAAEACAQWRCMELWRTGLLGELSARGVRFGTRAAGTPGWVSDMAEWVAAREAVEMCDARRQVRVAVAVRGEEQVAAAYCAGSLSDRQALRIAEFCQHPPKNVPAEAVGACRDYLLDAAAGTDLGGLGEHIEKLREVFADEDVPPAEDVERNELYASTTANGRVIVDGNFDAETGELLLGALSPLAKPQPGQYGQPDERSAARRRADAFSEMLRRYADAGASPSEGGEKPHLNVHIGLEELQRLQAQERRRLADRGAYDELFGTLGDSSMASMPWLGPLTVESARRLGCDCLVSLLVLDEHGVPLNLGHTRRVVSKAQRKALIARDGGCCFPGCGRPAAWTDAHHVVHWVDGGPTDLDNLALLCRQHHRLLHHSDWEIIMGADRHPWFLPPASRDPLRKPIPAHGRTGPPGAGAA